ncbi:MAG: fused MFS/spermidine synthase [Alphaproteobacteria bacterium]|nr:fused MFS/spermidine synthase [Alphaproteobacteria bacterium]
MLPLYAITLGLSALLLFWVQPLYARLMLPLLGGAPAVWITAMLFFQAALLAGYLYAHLSIRWLGLKRQSLLHGVLLLVAFVALPVALPQGWTPPASAMPVGWQLALMAAGIGLPFFAVSATAPLLQRWFAHTGHADSANPYFLYGASNIGSIAALLGYPVLAEPALRLGQQGLAWTGLYAALIALIGLCGYAMWRRYVTDPPGAQGEGLTLSPDIDWRRRLWWIALAFAPSSLMLGTTLHISTDLAAVPLLWVLPLALYLLTFVIVFARRPLLPQRWLLVLQVPALVGLAVAMSWDAAGPLGGIAIRLAAFFLIALACHGELAARRPAALHLTEFYLWMAVGGVLGGVFNAVLAPLLFDTVLEYPLMIAAVALLRPWKAGGGPGSLALDFVFPAGMAAVTIAMPLYFEWGAGGAGTATVVGAYVVTVGATAAFAFMGRPLRFALGLGVLLVAGPVVLGQGGQAGGILRNTILTERSFFGVHRVLLQPGPFAAHLLLHGTTVHGAQFLRPAARRRPLTYYHSEGPLGAIFNGFPQWRFPRVGVIGLGTGATACYAWRGQDWTFFEIDPTVVRIARDARYFTYLADCKPDATVVLGDARLSLQRVPDGSFDLLVLDAFSSDAIPVHLLTVEAFRLYRRKLSRRGVLAVHISNQFLDLELVVGRIAAEAGFFGFVRVDAPERQERLLTLRLYSKWAVMARRPDDIMELAPDLRWKLLRGTDAPLWTDDHVNIVRAFKPATDFGAGNPDDERMR